MRKLASISLFLFTGLAALAGPSRINDLSVTQTNGGVILRWVSPAPAVSTTLTNLDVRYSTSPINTLNWSAATRVVWLVDPGTPGTPQSAIVIGLTPGVRYYFAIKTQDSDGLWSTVSNVPQVTAGDALTSVIIAWDPAPDPHVVGYRIYLGTQSGIYSGSTAVGNVTTASVTNLQWGVTYYCAVTAYDVDGVESPFSNEISYTSY